MSISDYKRLNVDLLGAIVGYSINVIEPAAPVVSALTNVFTGLTEPVTFKGIWIKTDETVGDTIVETGFPASEPTWTSGNAMPSGDSYLAGASAGTNVYMCGGSANRTATRIFDTITGTWSSGNPMPSGDRMLAGAGVGTNVYICGGITSGTATRILDTMAGVIAESSGTIFIAIGCVPSADPSIPIELVDNFFLYVYDVWIVQSGAYVDYETYYGDGVSWTLLKNAE